MKTNNIIPIVCGCVALLVSIGAASEFDNNVSNNGVLIATVTTFLPFAALLACIYFVVKPKK